MTEFLTLAYLKTVLGVKDDKNDEKLLEIISEVNEEVSVRLTPYADVPISGAIYKRAQKAASFSAKAHWYEFTFLIDRATYNDDKFEKKMEQLIMALKAEKPERTETVFIPASNPRDIIYQPANIDEYITREFS